MFNRMRLEPETHQASRVALLYSCEYCFILMLICLILRDINIALSRFY